MKTFALLLLTAALAISGQREGNFTIRFEPKAILQADAQIPFEITVTDSRHQAVEQAKVTLRIETKEHTKTKVFPAPAVSPGVYLSKPVFPEPGEWSVYVEVHRSDQTSSRTLEFNVTN